MKKKKDVSLLLLVAFSILLLSIVGCVPDTYYMTTDNREHQIIETAKADAIVDAKIERWLWCSGGLCLGIGGGCLLGSLGIVGAYFYEPSPAPTRLVGKSPEYIALYVAYYKGQRNTDALNAASLGCTAGVLTAGCIATPWATVLGTFAGRIATERRW